MDKEKKTTYIAFAMRAAADFGATIAIPAVAGAFLGIWLDRKLGTTPWLTAALLIIAFALTWRMIKQKANAYGRSYDEMIRNDFSDEKIASVDTELPRKDTEKKDTEADR